MIDEPIDDTWISSLSTGLKEHELRKRRFAELGAVGSPLLFSEGGDPDRTYWAALNYKDVMAVGTANDVFSNEHGIMLGRAENMARTFKSMPFTGSMLAMDDPRHYEIRNIVSGAFTPKSIKSMIGMIDDVVKDVAEDLIRNHPEGVADFRTEFANKIPAQMTCRMMGIPAEDIDWIIREVVMMMQLYHPSHDDGQPIKWLRASRDMYKYALNLAETRKQDPTDDLTSAMLSASVENRALTVDEYADFFSLLVNAGIETTANIISAAFYFLDANPEQREDLENNFDELAVTACEELARIHSPIIHFMRTAVKETSVSGVDIKPGDRVVMFYHAANFDPLVFDDPFTFNVRRPLKPTQLSYGTPNSHFCLGANLARAEIKSALKAIFTYFPNFAPIYDEMTFCPSRWASGWRSMPVRFK